MSKQSKGMMIDNLGATYKEAEANIKAVADKLGIEGYMVEDLALAVRAFVQVRTVGGYPMVVTAQIMRLGDGVQQPYGLGKFVMGRIHMRTPDNQSTSGFGEIFFSKAGNNTAEALVMFTDLMKRMQKDG